MKFIKKKPVTMMPLHLIQDNLYSIFYTYFTIFFNDSIKSDGSI